MNNVQLISVNSHDVFGCTPGTPDVMTKGGEMIDYKTTHVVKLSGKNNTIENKLLLLV